ncbi:PIN domain-containing protein [Alcaligenaceae bacterium 429]|uniref:PIN domain-containing protein n=1 Tax=Paenalcaligenes sp. Me52 TaxID=3392038 RepID=UPI001092BB86|nr:PIN domain-containing protein [Alcaligenaceae bacterium 429]
MTTENLSTTDSTPVVVLDACIMISNVLRYLCLGLARAKVFQPAWSPVIADEWRRNASRLWEVPEAQLQLDWDAWQLEFPLADQGNVQLFKEGLRYSDPKDWHVIAAARAAQENFAERPIGVLTKNLKDFNKSELRRLGLVLWAPDLFLEGLWAEHAHLLLSLLEAMPAAVRAPDKPLLSVSALLKRERLYRFNRCYEQQILIGE